MDYKISLPITYLSTIYKVPLAESSAEKPSTGGSNETETPSSWWRRTGYISLKDAGVDPVICLCSSGDMNIGFEVIRVTEGILTSELEKKLWIFEQRTQHNGISPGLHSHHVAVPEG